MFLGCRLESEIRFWGSASGNPSIFLPIFNIKRQRGTRGESGVLGGGEKPNIKQIVKKWVKKSAAKSEKKSEKFDFFLLKMV